MALPDLTKLSGLELLRLADSDEAVRLKLAHRLFEGKPMTDYGTEEFLWDMYIATTGALLKAALKDIEPKEIIGLWLKKSGKDKNQKGRLFDRLYLYAAIYKNSSRKTLMEIYYEFVRPYLIETGQIQLDGSGEPDPYQDKMHRTNFLKAMARVKKTMDTPRK